MHMKRRHLATMVTVPTERGLFATPARLPQQETKRGQRNTNVLIEYGGKNDA